jgi:lysophospholipase L1-like esterase
MPRRFSFGRVGKAMLGVVAALVGLAVIEGILRIGWYGAERLASVRERVAFENPSDPSQRSLAVPLAISENVGGALRWNLQSNVLTYPDRHLLFRVQPNPTHEPVFCYEGIDELGFRNRTPAPPADVRVLLLGDSCAFGWGICKLENTLGPAIERQMLARGIRAAVFSRAQPGYSTAQGLILFRRWFASTAPHVVVLYFGWNDGRIANGMTDAEALRVMPLLSSEPIQFLVGTAMFRTLEAAERSILPTVWAANRARPAARPRVSRAESLANLRAMTTEARTAGAEVVVIPGLYTGGKFSPVPDIDGYNREIAEGLRGEATVLDLPEMMPGSAAAASYFQPDGYHPNARGASFIAAAVAAAVGNEPHLGS